MFKKYASLITVSNQGSARSFLNTQLVKGIHIRKEILSGNAKLDGGILTQCIKNFGEFNFEGSEIEPSCADYCLHFVICITHEFAKNKNSILNKSYDYMNIYYEILNLVLN